MEFNKYFDHTFLKAFATKQDIDTLCQQAKELNTASVCVNEEWVAYCKNLLKDTDVMVCSVVGFPLGQCGLNTKAYETKEALKDGADEIDMVINVAALKDGEEEMNAIVDCGGCIENVFVKHNVYGKLEAKMNISSRKQVKEFIDSISQNQAKPLTDLTSGYHCHTVSAQSKEDLDSIEESLRKLHILQEA